MKVRVSFYGAIRKPWEEPTRELDVAEGTSIDMLLDSLGSQPQEMRRAAVVVNGRRGQLTAMLQAGDDVGFTLLAGGG